MSQQPKANIDVDAFKDSHLGLHKMPDIFFQKKKPAPLRNSQKPLAIVTWIYSTFNEEDKPKSHSGTTADLTTLTV